MKKVILNIEALRTERERISGLIAQCEALLEGSSVTSVKEGADDAILALEGSLKAVELLIRTSESLVADQEHFRQPEIDICRACGEHAEFDENGSNCCSASAYGTDEYETNEER